MSGLKHAMALACLLGTAGCSANYVTVDRSTDFGDDGRAIHLDAKQRVVLTKKGQDDFGEIVCAEPGADALSAVSGGASLGVGATGTGSASGGASSSEGVGSLSLRTQTTETLKQTLYRICEMYFNRGLDRRMVMSLHQRFQNSTVAIAAIEQLTKATVAQAVAISGTAKAKASAETLLQIENVLKRAEERESQSERRLKESRLDAAKAQRKAREDRDAANRARSAGRPADEVARLDETASRSEAEAAQAQSDLEREEKASRRAKSNREAIAKSHEAAKSAAETEASATASLQATPAGGLAPTDAAGIASVAAAVEKIVLAHMQQDHVRDACVTFLAESAKVQTRTAAQLDKTTEAASRQKLQEALSETQSTAQWCQTYLSNNPVRKNGA